MTKPIRFAALIRVSTEKQAKKGESLTTQAAMIEHVVENLGGGDRSPVCGAGTRHPEP